MKYREFTIEPKMAEERDNIRALKSAIINYAYGEYSAFFAMGDFMKESQIKDIDYTREMIEKVEVDEYGRDANGIDIKGALRALEAVKAI